MGLGHQRKIVVHLPFDRARGYVNRRVGRRGGVNVTGMTGERVIAAAAKVPFVADLPAAGVDLNDRSAHLAHYHVSADRGNLYMPVLDAGESDWTIQRLHVYMRVTYVAHIHRSGRSLHADIALQLFCVHRPGCRV